MRISRVVVHDVRPAITYYVATSRSTYHRGVGMTPQKARLDLVGKRREGTAWMRRLMG